jgi:hypothetical protein
MPVLVTLEVKRIGNSHLLLLLKNTLAHMDKTYICSNLLLVVKVHFPNEGNMPKPSLLSSYSPPTFTGAGHQCTVPTVLVTSNDSQWLNQS